MINLDNKILIKIIFILKNNPCGLIITDIVNKTKLNRSAIRVGLAKLDGGNKVLIKKIGMAKIYYLKK